MCTELRLYPKDYEALHRAKVLIEENIVCMPSLQELSKKVCLNQDKLKKGFRHTFGVPPYAYHISIRMKEAVRLLLQTDQMISEIAWTVGYEYASNFCNEFKKYTGISPGAFRKKAGAGCL